MSKDFSKDLIGEWCEHHHTLNNISRPRRVQQLRALRWIEATLPGPFELIEARDIERWMAQMIRDGYHPHTVVFNLKLVRPLIRWMWREGMIDAERWLRLQAVRGPRGAYDGKPRPYTREQIRRFWKELDATYPWTHDRDPDERTPARGEYWVRRWALGYSPWRRVIPYALRLQVEAIVSLALYAGLRRNEIFEIALEDMAYQNEYVRVVSRKGAEGIEKLRVVPMNDALMVAIGNWIEFREQVLAPDHDFAWVSVRSRLKGLPLTSLAFRYLLRRIGDGDENWMYHRLRHTFATERYRAGLPIEILAATLGHTDIKRTLGYAKIESDRIISASKATDEAFLKALAPGSDPADD